jgi:glycosyl transferase family 25
MDQIEKVIYINLAHRTDRRNQIEKELSVFPSYKIIRFDAIYEKDRGHLGCSKSHIAVLEMAIANKWKNYLVVEDDMMWNMFQAGSQILNKIIKENPDVVVLGGSAIDCDKITYKLRRCCCTTAYLVFEHYYETLLSNFKEGATLLEENYNSHNSYAIDQHWMKLQERDKWYIVSPIMCLQRAGYSDINGKNERIKLGDVKYREFLPELPKYVPESAVKSPTSLKSPSSLKSPTSLKLSPKFLNWSRSRMNS